MNEDDKNFIRDMLKTEGWRLLASHFQLQADERRRMATQRPEAITDQLRGWYAAEASGIEEVLTGATKLVE